MSIDPLLPVWLLGPVAVATAAAAWLWLRRDRAARRLMPAVTGTESTHRSGGAVRWSVMGALMLLAALDPTIAGGRAAVKRSDANVLFVVDTTGSMAALDYDGGAPRLDGVRADIMALADEFPGAHFALATFNSKTRVIVPWTTDRGALDSAVQLLRQEWTLYAKGTRLDEPLPTMRQMLPRAGPDGGYDVLFLLTDGEQTEQPAPQSFESLRDSVAGGAVLGYGTAEGARMHVYIGRGEDPEQFIHDYATGSDARSRIDEENLTDVAEQVGVQYVHRTEPSGVGDIAESATEQVGTVYAGERDTVRRLYWVPAFGVVALVLWQSARTGLEIADDRRALGRTRLGRTRLGRTRLGRTRLGRTSKVAT